MKSKNNKDMNIKFRDENYNFSVVLEPDKETGGYTVSVPALPGCFTEGDTIEEAMKNAKEAILCHLEGMIADGEEIPTSPDSREFISMISIKFSELQNSLKSPNAKIALG